MLQILDEKRFEGKRVSWIRFLLKLFVGNAFLLWRMFMIVTEYP